MSARALATATVSFGLVSIPVKLYSTSESSSGISFNWLHKKCGSRVKQQYYCPTDDEVVGNDDMVKGYEFSKGQYVLFSEEELKGLTQKPTESIDIIAFLDIAKVDPIYFEKSYYLGPNKGGDRPYRLLAETMRQSGRAALAQYAARGKQYVVLLRPFEQGLIMQQLKYADELKAFSEVPIGEAEPKPAELELARQLVDQTTAEEFHPEQYKDESNERLKALIEQKVEGKEVQAVSTEEPKAQIIDLMEALKASVARRSEEEAEARKGPRRVVAAKRAEARKTASGRASKES